MAYVSIQGIEDDETDLVKGADRKTRKYSKHSFMTGLHHKRQYREMKRVKNGTNAFVLECPKDKTK